MELDSLYEELDQHLQKLEDKYVKDHLKNPESQLDDFLDDVKVYCILAHAYFEEYFEQLLRQVMRESTNLWKYKGDITQPLLTLLSYSNKRLDISTFNNGAIHVLEELINYALNFMEDEIENNHGIRAEKHLNKLLFPVSVDIPKLTNDSLKTLCDARGFYAHKNARSCIGPEKAKQCVTDCLELCMIVKTSAKKHFENVG